MILALQKISWPESNGGDGMWEDTRTAIQIEDTAMQSNGHDKQDGETMMQGKGAH